jgi:hypothetical protein
VIVPGFLSAEENDAAIRDFPKLDMAGLFVPDDLTFGPAFGSLLEAMRGPEVRAVVAEKLDLDLSGKPTMVTLRGCAQAKDGRIHADSKFKLATLLLYLNEPWQSTGGQLRLLRSADDIEDYAREIPPEGGTLVCFKVQPNSWHGHKPFVGLRRYLMLNYCQSEALRDRELGRHRLSGRVKKVKRWFGIGKMAVT